VVMTEKLGGHEGEAGRLLSMLVVAPLPPVVGQVQGQGGDQGCILIVIEGDIRAALRVMPRQQTPAVPLLLLAAP
jgi:hypothetical protein